MGKRIYPFLFITGLLIAVGAASFQSTPGYMDADYYYAGALRIISGQGAQEPYLWNFLNNPNGLPAPSFSYWMPFISLVASSGLAIAGAWGFWGARLGFILLAAMLSPLTALLSFRLTARPHLALLSGLLVLFPGFYLPFLTTTDAFPIYMVLGAVFLLTIQSISSAPIQRQVWLQFILLGIISGLFHMTRADGLLWSAAAGIFALVWAVRPPHGAARPGTRRILLRAAAVSAAVLGGYVLVAAPWYLRNIVEWGRLMPPGGSRALWITEYEQTMIFPPDLLTPAHWLAEGWRSHMQVRLSAISGNFQTALAVQGGIVAFPFILIGMWKMRRRVEVGVGAWMWLATAGVMSLVFPFAGINGSFFHSGAALQPLLWALAPAGVESAVNWYARKRRLENPRRMMLFLSGVLVLVSVFLSGLIYYQRVVGKSSGELIWDAGDRHYRMVETALRENGANQGAAVLVNNPPGYWLASGRPAVVIPYGDEQMLLAAAQKFHVEFVVLESTNPHQLSDLYHNRAAPPELEYLESVGETKLYRVHLEKGTQ